ncbi:MAG: DUF2807 domain-containing protein [Deltaproteobacteria bacterium]|nr:DUF2807 domain-containing protein [Deltaproteobacteria bacterium]MBK8241474.1 DUF2807 domain-containing protein [Deltaproteobacteria bacterium]MBK8717186.1 DUF2807 domain-containing protein [Deltaproteobacteria bacterium]MBP7286290.1 DUF2807 domain-containing protein [Nannocystaceae bacterium]
MTTRRRPLTLACLTLGLTACMERGNGEPSSIQPELAPFHAVDVGGVFHLQATRTDGPQAVELRGDANLVPKVELAVDDGVLQARLHDNVLPSLDLVLVVRTPTLDRVSLGGAARAELTGLSGDAFTLALSGASHARASGRVTRLHVDASGASTIDAAATTADEVEVDASGASSIDVTAEVSLDADASGASHVRWAGNAGKVEPHTSGASSVERR